MRWRLLSFVTFAVAAGLLSVALVARSRIEQRQAGERTTFYYEIPAKRDVDCFVSSSPLQLRIHTMLVAPRGCTPEGPVPYRIEITWLDREGIKRRYQVLAEQTRFTRYPALSSGPLRHARIPHDDRAIAEERINFIPVAKVLPKGGSIRIGVRAASASALLRVFAEEPRDKLAVERLIPAPSRAVQESVERRSGMSSWSLLAPAERRSLLAGRWMRLELRGIGARELVAHRVKVRDVDVGWKARHVPHLALDAGRMMAINLRGPVKVRLSGDEMIEQLEASLVADLPAGSSPRIEVRPAEVIGFAEEKGAKILSIDSPAALSLQLLNKHPKRPARFFLSVDRLRPEQRFANTPHLWFSQLVAATGRATALIGPNLRVLGGYLLGKHAKKALMISMAGFEGTHVLAITARPLRAKVDDGRPARLVLVARDASGKALWQREAEVPFVASRFERLLPTTAKTTDWAALCPKASRGQRGAVDGRWLGEPQELYLAGGQGLRTIEIRSPEDMLVSIKAQGADAEYESYHPTKNATVRLRYDYRLRDRWEVVEALNHQQLDEAGQRRKFLANTRLAPPSAKYMPRRSPGARRYETLAALGRPRADVWLTPLEKTAATSQPAQAPPALRNIYCRYGGSWRGFRFNYTPTAAMRLRHRLYGVMTCPAPYLGAPFSIELDQKRWRQGRILQEVTRFSRVRAKPHQHIKFEGPPGCTLWMKSFGSARICAAPFRPIGGYALPTGASLSFSARKSLAEQFFVVGGVGDRGGEVRIEVGGDLRRRGGVFDSYTRSVRRVALPALASRAQRLDRPGAGAALLEPHGIRLNADLPARTYRIRVVNVGGRPLHIWALWQTLSAAGEQPPGNIRWVYERGDEL